MLCCDRKMFKHMAGVTSWRDWVSSLEVAGRFGVRQLLFFLGLSGRAGPLPINGNKLLGSLGHRSYPQGAPLQAELLGAEGEVGAIWSDSVWSRGASTTERCPR